ncbi:hypothetical protein NMY3_02826 [Candidatus Nitrosocosmicus oleophilus]|jgi:hypothetical protein|uniref:Uncharacterized protein n=1 Tax=Candidatus Nitrosocosmicus oleophilus TaxID=1353260 RepID=A0A654M322_9ARCH|nr:hypothetical protein NMY3_02826 [Candidatus Nitrosocosmicus oleophilus]
MNQKNRRHCVENGLLRFFTIQNQRVKDEEISVEMIRNYLKPVKFYCEMNGVVFNWKII